LLQTSEGDEAADLSGPFAVTIRLKFLNDTERDVEANLVEKIGAFKRRNFTQATLCIGIICLQSWIPDPNFSISVPGSSMKKNSGSRIRIKEFKYFNTKTCL
jgi:hypothetical protein